MEEKTSWAKGVPWSELLCDAALAGKRLEMQDEERTLRGVISNVVLMGEMVFFHLTDPEMLANKGSTDSGWVSWPNPSGRHIIEIPLGKSRVEDIGERCYEINFTDDSGRYGTITNPPPVPASC